MTERLKKLKDEAKLIYSKAEDLACKVADYQTELEDDEEADGEELQEVTNFSDELNVILDKFDAL